MNAFVWFTIGLVIGVMLGAVGWAILTIGGRHD